MATGFVEDLDFLEIKAMLRAREGCVSRLIPLPDHDAGLGLIGSIKYCVRRCAYELRTRFVIFELGIDWVQKICPRSWRVISAIEEEIFKDRLQNLFANDLFELKMNGLNDAKNNSSSSTMLAQLMEKYESRSNNAGRQLPCTLLPFHLTFFYRRVFTIEVDHLDRNRVQYFTDETDDI